MKQLVQETIEPLPVRPGQPQRDDYQYERNVTAVDYTHQLMLDAPLVLAVKLTEEDQTDWKKY